MDNYPRNFIFDVLFMSKTVCASHWQPFGSWQVGMIRKTNADWTEVFVPSTVIVRELGSDDLTVHTSFSPFSPSCDWHRTCVFIYDKAGKSTFHSRVSMLQNSLCTEEKSASHDIL
jgi:hypothetical protein